jgi:hypothetical protein
MLYLIYCDFDLRKAIDDSLRVKERRFFAEIIFVDNVPDYKYKFTIDEHDVYFYLVVVWDDMFLRILRNLCTFSCIQHQDENENTIGLYRIVGIEDEQYYENMLISMMPDIVAFNFIENVVVRCRDCIQESHCDSLGTGMLWVEWNKTANENVHFKIHFERVLHYRFFDENFYQHVIHNREVEDDIEETRRFIIAANEKFNDKVVRDECASSMLYTDDVCMDNDVIISLDVPLDVRTAGSQAEKYS